MRRIVNFIASVVVAILAAAVLWLALMQGLRVAREDRDVDQLAGGHGRWLAVGDGRLHVQEWGDADAPIVLLTHGTGAWSGTWFGLPDALAADGWRVVAVDLPPFGLSTLAAPPGTADFTRTAQATRLLGLVAQLGRPVRMVGHSFGAGPAYEAAMRGGPSIARLVLVDPALGYGPAGEEPRCDPTEHGWSLLKLRPVRTALVSATATWPPLTGELLKTFVHRKAVVDETVLPAYRIPFARRGFSADLGDWAAVFANATCEDAISLDGDALGRWAATGPPVRLVWGAEDTITPIAQARSLLRQMPAARLAVIPDVGHIPHIEAPDALAAALRASLRD